MNRKTVKQVFLFLFISILVSACMPGSIGSHSHSPAGFLMGIWHGWIAPVSLIAGLFNPDIRVYETINNGWWYDFGFYVAIIGGFGGLSLFRKKKEQ